MEEGSLAKARSFVQVGGKPERIRLSPQREPLDPSEWLPPGCSSLSSSALSFRAHGRCTRLMSCPDPSRIGDACDAYPLPIQVKWFEICCCIQHHNTLFRVP